MLGELELQLIDRNVRITYTNAAAEWISERGYDRLYAAQPMARLIDEKIKEELVDQLLFGKLENGGTVHVDMVDGARDAGTPGCRSAGRRCRS